MNSSSFLLQWGSVRLALVASAFLAQVAAQSGAFGCMYGPYTSCIDPAPATYLSGSWIEDDAESEWTLTANDGAPLTLGDVTGTVLVFAQVQGCPKVNYTVKAGSSHYSPSAISYPQEGTTSFDWTAYNPVPSGVCGNKIPTSQMEFKGAIPNKGNDTGSGT